MSIDIRYAEHPDDVQMYDTEDLRDHFLFDNVFAMDEISLCYTHTDRVVFGGAMPAKKALKLEGGKDFGSEVFLDRRELGVICIAGEGSITADGTEYRMKKGDGIYIGKETKDIVFASSNAANPPRFYLVSAPAHTKISYRVYPDRKGESPQARRAFDGKRPHDLSVCAPRRLQELPACYGHDRSRRGLGLEHDALPYSRTQDGSVFLF